MAAASIGERAQDALARRDLSALFELTDEAASLPPGTGSKLVNALGALADLASGRLEDAITRLQSVGPLAISALAVASLIGALVFSALLYLPCALWVSIAGRRELTNRMAPAEWRSPLGLREGLILCMADDALGFAGALAVAWAVFHAPEAVLTLDLSQRPGAVAALAGTATGNLGALALALILYRWRGAGAAAAGLVPMDVRRIVFYAVVTAVPLLLLSLVHEVAFFRITGREPRSNVEPMLQSLFADGASPGLVLGLVLTVVVIAPVVEETIYRGVVYRAFRDRAGVPLSILLSGLLFSIAHLEPDHLLALWLIGGTLAWLTERTGSIIPSIAAHGLFNSLSLGAYLLTQPAFTVSR
jgi:membrane protease YdiL (CAAX protease family)